MKLKYDINLMNLRTIFENVTHADVKDCFLKDNLLLVIVKENEMGKAIGRAGVNIINLEKKFNKKIKIIEFNNDIIKFTQNLINPVKAINIKLDDEILTIHVQGTREKGQIIGRESKNLHDLKDMLSLYFGIKDIKII